MKLEVYNEAKESEKITYFKLQNGPSKNTLKITAVTRDGMPISDILFINEKGIHLYEGINKESGIPLDKNGKPLLT